MTRRTRLAALFAAAGLLSMAASAAIAAPGGPTYFISVTKSANPTAVPTGGASVDFTVSITNTGTGFFQSVVVTDTMAGCTVAGPTVDTGSDGKLSPGETWAYTCTVANVHPGDSNTANVHACHNVTACVSGPDATGSGSVTLDQGPDVSAPPTEAPPTEAPPTEAPPTEAPPTEAPPTEAVPTLQPSQAVGDATNAPGASLSSTDTDGIVGGPHGADLKTMLLLLSVLFFLVASIIVMTPAAPKAKTSARS
jgi:uncharacterized repeat protein (TIGR01451 family)